MTHPPLNLLSLNIHFSHKNSRRWRSCIPYNDLLLRVESPVMTCTWWNL